MIAIPFLASLAALFFCFLSIAFGSPNGAIINLPPDYNTFGWVTRGFGAVLAVIAITILVSMHKHIQKGTFASFIGKLCMVISISCVVWEIAILVAIFAVIGLALYGFASGDGIGIDL
jgi:hypothetical protein